LTFTIAMAMYYFNALTGDEKNDFLPGNTSDGHYQIENKCDTCHGDGFDDRETLQKSCVRCHKQELKMIEDSHPKSKFTNPRNADRIKILDARYCVTCHVEHKTGKTRAMGVSLPEDYCFLCHENVEKKRPSHKGMGYETCDDAGCHNYHDNKALYEEFLVKHNDEDKYLPEMKLPVKNIKAVFRGRDEKFTKSLSIADIDSPRGVVVSQKISYQWHASSHSKSGVNCQECHLSVNEKKNVNEKKEWLFKPNYKHCEKCHLQETKGFLQSRHGMRLAEGLPAMQVKDARLKMHESAKDKVLNCQSCHSDHSFNTEKAAIDSCLSCHADDHSNAYKKSKHYRAFLSSMNGKDDSKESVTCAGCHLPRVASQEDGVKRILVDHNQNNYLRPNEKMIRSVCMNCHGLKFSLESLADRKLILNNFTGEPSIENKGFALAMEREALKRKGLIKEKN